MEPKAERLLETLTDTNASMDAKIENLLAIKADIKQNNVPENALPTLFDSIKLGISSQYTRYCGAAFSTLGNLVRRLFSQEQQRLIATYARILYPVLLDRLGDQKERIRAHAFQAFVDFWPASQREVEEAVLVNALTGRNPRAKQMAIEWLLFMATNHGLMFRCYVPDVVRCLEDADVSIREAAKSTLVDLFVNRDDENKAFLKRALEDLKNNPARKTTREWILDRVGPFEDPNPRGPNSDRIHQMTLGHKDRARVNNERRLVSLENKIARKERDITLCKFPVDNLRQKLDFGGEKANIERAVAPVAQDPPRSKTPVNENALQLQRSAHTVPTWDEADVLPLIVKSAHQVEDIFSAMAPHFEGRETEKNWDLREKHVILLRQVVIGNAPRDYPQIFYPNVKTQLDNIFKAVFSLRTTLSSNGCYFVIDMARWLGPGIDGMVEIIIQHLFRVCTVSKRITAQNGNKAVIAVMANVSYNHRLLHHIQSAGGDKNVQLRQFSAEWLRTIINRHTSVRAAIEHGNGLSLIIASIKIGLADPNPNVRDEMRHTYWSFHMGWPSKAQTIASEIDNKSRLLLEKSEHNPKQQSTLSPPETKVPAKSRSALKSAIAAQKRVHLKTNAIQSTKEHPSKALPAESSSVAAPLLHSAPVRPKFRRPEGDRPAIADPRAHLTDLRKGKFLDTRFMARAKPADCSTTDDHAQRQDGSGGETNDQAERQDGSGGEANDQAERQDGSGGETNDQAERQDSGGDEVDQANGQKASDCDKADHKVQKGHRLDDPQGALEDMVVFDPCCSFDLSEEPDLPTNPSPIIRRRKPIALPSTPSSVWSPPPKRPLPRQLPKSPPIGPSNGFVGVANEAINKESPASSHHSLPTVSSGMPDWLQKAVQDARAKAMQQAIDESWSMTDSWFGEESMITAEQEIARVEGPNQQGDAQQENLQQGDAQLENLQQGDAQQENLQQGDAQLVNLQQGDAQLENLQQGDAQLENLQQGDAQLENLQQDDSQQEELPKKEVVEARSELEQPRVRHVSFRVPSTDDDDPRFGGALMERSEETSNRRALVSYPSGSQDPNRSQQLLDRGIQLIRSNRMDPHGFRRLRLVLESGTGTTVSQEQFQQLVLALTSSLKRGHPPGKVGGETAMLPLLDVLEHTIVGRDCEQTRFTPQLYHQTITAFLETKRRCDASTYFAVRLDGVARSLVKAELNAGTYSSVDAILDIVTEKGEDNNSVIVMGLLLLADLLRLQLATKFCLPENILRRIGTLAANKLTDGQAEVRRLVCQLCVQLKGVVGEERFWEFLGTPSIGSRNLLAYYLARG